MTKINVYSFPFATRQEIKLPVGAQILHVTCHADTDANNVLKAPLVYMLDLHCMVNDSIKVSQPHVLLIAEAGEPLTSAFGYSYVGTVEMVTRRFVFIR